MSIDFYYHLPSPPCRTVLLLAKTLGLELNLKEVAILNGEHKKPEFLKINPQHCIPTLVDNGFVLWESRAILAYLVNKYGKNDSLYPKDPKKRAIVDQRLYFDIGTMYPKLREYFLELRSGKTPGAEIIAKVEDTLELLDKFLDGHEWVAGDNMTIADFSIVMTISFSDLLKYDISKHKNVSRWFAKAKKTMVGYKELYEPAAAALQKMMAASHSTAHQ